MFALFGTAILGADPLLHLFYGSGFGDAVPILRLLLVAVLLPAFAAVATSSLLVAQPDGQRIFAWCNVGGLVAGLLSMVVLLRVRHDIAMVAWGYLLGAAVVGLVPFLVVWRRERHQWLGVTLQVLVGGIVVAALGLTENALDADSWRDVAISLIFGILWLAVCRRNVLAMKPTVAGGMPSPESPTTAVDASRSVDPGR
jgi:O-antigen/teichoic acid export membrane protein